MCENKEPNIFCDNCCNGEYCHATESEIMDVCKKITTFNQFSCDDCEYWKPCDKAWFI